MNIVFWMLVILFAIVFWLALSSKFWDIGDVLSNLLQNAKDAMNEEEIEEDEINE